MSSPTSNAGNNFPGLQGPGSAKFKVAVRVRPLLPHEHATNVNVVSINNNTVTVVDPFDLKHQRAGRQMDVIHRSREQKFAFDHVFTTQGVTEIFSLTARDIVDDSANGYKGCVFAYGATGSGKTFTMLGREGEVKGMNETCLEVYLVLSLVSLPEVCTRLSKRLQNHGFFRRNLQRIHNRPAQAEEQRLP